MPVGNFVLPTLENISSLRAAVRGINYNDTATLAYYLELSAYSQILIQGSKARDEHYEKLLRRYYRQIGLDTEKILQTAKDQLDVQFYDNVTDERGNPIVKVDQGPPLELLDYWESIQEARERHLETIKWKGSDTYEPPKPFVGNKRTHEFPKWGEPITSHIADQTIADRVVWEYLVPSELALSADQKDYTYNYNSSSALSSEAGVEKLYKAWFVNGKPWGHRIPSNPYLVEESERLRAIDKAAKGSYKFFIEKLHGRGSKGPYKAGSIKPDGTFSQYPNRMVFPAYISRINDSFATNSEEYEFSGRGEKVYAYKNTTRTINLEFIVLADFSAELLALGAQAQEEAAKSGFLGQAGDSGKTNSFNANNDMSGTNNFFPQIESLITGKETSLGDGDKLKEYVPMDWGDGSSSLPRFTDKGEKVGFIPGVMSGTPEMLWERLNFIAQCCYPWYRNDGKLKEAPYIRIRITDFHDLVCKVDSLAIDTEDFEVDLNPSTLGNIPMGAKITMGLTVIHSEEPSSDYFHFFHRKDFDSTPNQKTTSNTRKETSATGDSFLDEAKINSPLTFKTPDLLTGGNGTGVANWVGEYTNSLNEFTQSSNGLSELNKGARMLTQGGVQNFATTKVLERALKAAKKLTDLRSLQDAYNYFKPVTDLANSTQQTIATANEKVSSNQTTQLIEKLKLAQKKK